MLRTVFRNLSGISGLHFVALVSTTAACGFFWWVSSLAAAFDHSSSGLADERVGMSLLSVVRWAALILPMGAWMSAALGLKRVSMAACGAPWLFVLVAVGWTALFE